MKPLLDPRTTPHLGVDRLPEQKEAQIAYILRHMIQKDKYYGKSIEIGVRNNPIDPDFAKRKDYHWIYNAVNNNGLEWDVLDNPAVVGAMKRFGYDGTFVQENRDYSGKSIFVMEPNQIKIVNVK